MRADLFAQFGDHAACDLTSLGRVEVVDEVRVPGGLTNYVGEQIWMASQALVIGIDESIDLLVERQVRREHLHDARDKRRRNPKPHGSGEIRLRSEVVV